MPVGVPKVLFLLPEEEEESWVDLYNRLSRQRFVFLSQEIVHKSANQVLGLMIHLTLEDNTKDQYLFLNSPGGGLLPGLGIFDMAASKQPYVFTVGLGQCASMASLILCGGKLTERVAFPHARVMLHQPYSLYSLSEMPENLEETELILKLRVRVAKTYVKITHQKFETIWDHMGRDIFMTPKEAQAFGVVDFVGGKFEFYYKPLKPGEDPKRQLAEFRIRRPDDIEVDFEY
uniref:ATP-dependent Clp protease proteolytic subunit n=1 Tax=Carpodetus serratus TaxID=54173 RepID=A0A291F1X5_9ASTR|nr:ATP-dependent protease proteolytic subunit [Carpodetus serratus]ATG26125.1 ATP-dependent protease proteolytic subunit [Carpodetus serratus]